MNDLGVSQFWETSIFSKHYQMCSSYAEKSQDTFVTLPRQVLSLSEKNVGLTQNSMVEHHSRIDMAVFGYPPFLEKPIWRVSLLWWLISGIVSGL